MAEEYFSLKYWAKKYFAGRYFEGPAADGEVQGGPLVLQGSALVSVLDSEVERLGGPTGGFPQGDFRRRISGDVRGGKVGLEGKARIEVLASGVNNDSEILVMV